MKKKFTSECVILSIYAEEAISTSSLHFKSVYFSLSVHFIFPDKGRTSPHGIRGMRVRVQRDSLRDSRNDVLKGRAYRETISAKSEGRPICELPGELRDRVTENWNVHSRRDSSSPKWRSRMHSMGAILGINRFYSR